MIEKIVTAIVTTLVSKLATWILERHAKKQAKEIAETNIDHNLSNVKKAYEEIANGVEFTPEKRLALHDAITNFIKSPGNGNGL